MPQTFIFQELYYAFKRQSVRNKKRLLLTAAVATAHNVIDSGYNIPLIVRYIVQETRTTILCLFMLITVRKLHILTELTTGQEIKVPDINSQCNYFYKLELYVI